MLFLGRLQLRLFALLNLLFEVDLVIRLLLASLLLFLVPSMGVHTLMDDVLALRGYSTPLLSLLVKPNSRQRQLKLFTQSTWYFEEFY